MRRLLSLTAVLLLAASPAMAHPGHAGGGFVAGFAHPFFGLDHLLAMVAVGLWAGVAFDKGVWAWPATFATCTLAGFAYAAMGGTLPAVEGLILSSVVALGLAVALRWQAPVALGSALIALFALAHGAAHGAEVAPGLHPATFAAGMVLATLLLHAAGAAGGLLARGLERPVLARAAGLGIAAGGLAMVLAS